MGYEFRISCGCTCRRCGRNVVLEGYEDADGNHYCASCDDYVSASPGRCAERTEAKVAARVKLGAYPERTETI